jgi:anaerobic ribonucleoside-triphosphate reductase activating protein
MSSRVSGTDRNVQRSRRASRDLGDSARRGLRGSTEMKLTISRVLFPVTALGPGRRVGIWVQGCSIGCLGCVSRDTWSREGGREATIDSLCQTVEREIQDGCSGVTISGGEPFDQAPALAALTRQLRALSAARSMELDILCYSGYSLRRLRRLYPNVLVGLDGVITGPFVEGQPTDLVLRGSANQEFVALSELGQVRYGDVLDRRTQRPAFQVAVENNAVTMIGIPRRGDLARLSDLAADRGVHLNDVSWSA